MTTLTQVAEARVELRTAIKGRRRFEDEGSHPQGFTYDELDTWVRTARAKLEKLISDYPGDWRYNTGTYQVQFEKVLLRRTQTGYIDLEIEHQKEATDQGKACPNNCGNYLQFADDAQCSWCQDERDAEQEGA